jgi:hypothetical protein
MDILELLSHNASNIITWHKARSVFKVSVKRGPVKPVSGCSARQLSAFNKRIRDKLGIGGAYHYHVCLARHPCFVIWLSVFFLVLLHIQSLLFGTFYHGSDTTKIDLRDKNVPWYDRKLKKLGPSVRELLENYSKIPPAEVEDHIYKIVNIVLNLIRRG